MARTVIAIVNAGSGGGNDAALVERLQGFFAAAGANAEIVLVHDGAEIEAKVEAAIARRPDAIVAGGGDGTVSAVAGALAGGEIPLGVLPLGTLNHFAKDFGLPIELEAAVGHVVRGRPVEADVAEVNGRVFVNNSSLGLYPDIVRDRERQQSRLGRGKWAALVWASIAALRRYPFLDVRIEGDGGARRRRTPFVFVGNNRYEMEGLAIGSRERLDEGVLGVYFAQRPARWRLVAFGLRALFGRLRQARDFDALVGPDFIVHSRHRQVRISVDGETCRMAPPLRYRSRPGALRVLRDDAAAVSSS